MRIVLAILVIALGLFPLGRHASAAYVAAGVGNSSCGAWIAVRRHPDGKEANEAEQWILGFLSGVGFSGGQGEDPIHGTDAEGVWMWIDTYCQGNPLKDIAVAAAAFVFSHPH
jgi:hypothetical protein